jgi:hypothetical protein
MSDIKINDITVFGELKRGIGMIGQRMPGALSNTGSSLEGLKRDVLVDIKETEKEIDKQKKAAIQAEKEKSQGGGEATAKGSEVPRANMSQLNAKLGALKNAFSNIEHLLIRFRQLKTKEGEVLSTIPKANLALDELEQIARVYLQMPATSTGNSNAGTNPGDGYSPVSELRMVGDTFHFTRGSQLGQMQIDKLELQVKQNSIKGNKISIDKVSSLDFSLLEKNGYQIQKVGANDYSAYKMIKK